MSLKDDYYKKCATCSHYALLNPAQVNHIGFKCHDKGSYYALDDGCNSGLFGGYSYNRKVTDKNISDAIKMVSKQQESGCYITTIICKILNLPDNHEYLKTLRYFRAGILQRNEKYNKLLFLYDNIGPMISFCLENDPYKEEIAKVLFDYYLKPICAFIEEGKYDYAIEAYVQMTLELQRKYDIQDIEYDESYNSVEEKGHGRVRKL